MKLVPVIILLLQSVQGSRFDEKVKDFEREMNELVNSEGTEMISDVKTGMMELKDTVSQHIYDVAQSLGQIDTLTRSKRDVGSSEEVDKRPTFSIIKLISCRNLTKVLTEVGLAIEETAVVIARSVGVATNYTIAMSNCSGNPICLITIISSSGMIISETYELVNNHIGKLKTRLQRVISIIMTCATGSPFPVPTQPPPPSNVTDPPVNTTSTTAVTPKVTR